MYAIICSHKYCLNLLVSALCGDFTRNDPEGLRTIYDHVEICRELFHRIKYLEHLYVFNSLLYLFSDINSRYPSSTAPSIV
jgi:hypothetical protein